MHADSQLVRGRATNPSGGVSPPLDRSTTFERWPPRPGGPPYGRDTSPTAQEAEDLLGELEQARALVFASGMTAFATLCLAVLRPGQALAIPDRGYYGVDVLSSELLDGLGIVTRRYDANDHEAAARAASGAALLVVETPSNPLLGIVDIAATAAAARRGGALCVCDNTAATPLLQQPLDLGADIAWQSATKYLAGHSDALAGVLTTRNEELASRVARLRTSLGGLLAPDPSWLLLRGLRTLAVRVERQSLTALELAQRLAAHAAVTHVHYPGLPDHPGHDLAAAQMHGRFGGLLSFEVVDGVAAEAVEGSLGLIRRATSLGSVESLCERRDRFEPTGRVPPGLLRLSVGLEHVDDLWADLDQALASS